MSKILVVDDTPIARQGTALLLTALGHDVDEARDGREALKKFSVGQYELILLDYHMPHMNGIECAMAIRELERSVQKLTPIVCLSSDADIRESCPSAGIDDFLQKDCSGEEIRRVIEKWCVDVNADGVFKAVT